MLQLKNQRKLENSGEQHSITRSRPGLALRTEAVRCDHRGSEGAADPAYARIVFDAAAATASAKSKPAHSPAGVGMTVRTRMT